MNERLKRYYRWRIETILRRKFLPVTKILNIITPTYHPGKRSELVLRVINSILGQTSHNLRVKHFIVCDEEIPVEWKLSSPAWYEQHFIPPIKLKRYSTDYRNAGLKSVTRGWVMMLSDENELLPGCFTAIERNLSSRAGTILFRVRRGSDGMIIPTDSDRAPSFEDSPSLALIVNTDVAWIVDYQHRLLRDFQYIENIQAMSAHYGFENLSVQEIIGIDRDVISVKPVDTKA